MKKRIQVLGMATLVSLMMIGCTTTQEPSPQEESVPTTTEIYEEQNGKDFTISFLETIKTTNITLKTNMGTLQSSMDAFVKSGTKEDFTKMYGNVLMLNKEAESAKEELKTLKAKVQEGDFELNSSHMATLDLLVETMDNTILFTDCMDKALSANDKDLLGEASSLIQKVKNSIDILDMMLDEFIKKEVNK